MKRSFFLFALIVGFFISMEYGITRPASQSIFLTTFSSSSIPWAWLATVPLNYLLISFYNFFLIRKGPIGAMTIISLLVILIQASTPLLISIFPSYIFFQYCWKEVYVLLMFKQLWSMVHSVATQEEAKSRYGILFLVGTIGAIFGSLVPSFSAVRLGSESLFYFTIPIYTIVFLAYRSAFLRSSIEWKTDVKTSNPASKEAFSMISKSPYLLSILLLVLLMQASVGLMEYRFNFVLEGQILEKDLRTEYMGQMVSWINLLGTSFHLGGSYLLIHFLGVKKAHLTIPLLLLANHMTSLIFPAFGYLSFAYVLVKGVDYSLFGVLREMLYIPMRTDEKYRAKAIIDVFAYRTSKALLSLGILGFQAILGVKILASINVVSVAIFIAWSLVVTIMLWKYYPQKIEIY